MRQRRPLFLLAGLAIAALVAACGQSTTPAWTFAPAASPGAGASAAPSAAASQPATGGGEVLGTIDIEAFDLGFKPAEVTVEKAGRYTVNLRNTGAIPHDVTFADGTTTGLVNGGQSGSAEVDIPAGGTTFNCSVPGHKEAGMTGTVSVAGGTAGASPAPSASPSGDHGGPGAALPGPDPNAPKYTLRDATAPKVLDGTVHDIDLVIEEKTMTVAEGYVMSVWTFNGTAPGPVIRVHQGDTIRVHLKNPATNQLAHSIDFHSSQVAWNDEMTSINPGEEKLYEWTADYAGVWMYHCGTSPALHHIANGMYGMVIVEPTGGLPPVDHEFAIVQSEWYFDAQGQISSLAKASAGAPAPDWVVFNGVAKQYFDNPIKVGTGKTVRFFVLDAGPSIDSAFHIVGTIFNTVIKEGVQLGPSNPGHYGSQTVDLAPAQGAIIELTTAEDGLYPIVTHAFNFPGRGALGVLQAGDGDPAN